VGWTGKEKMDDETFAQEQEETPRFNYEITFLVKEGDSSDPVFKVLESLEATITKQKDMGVIALSYPIKKQIRAHYHWASFEILPENLLEAEKKLTLEANPLRYLIVKKLREPDRSKLEKREKARAGKADKISQADKKDRPSQKPKVEIPEKKEETVPGKIAVEEKPVVEKEAEKKTPELRKSIDKPKIVKKAKTVKKAPEIEKKALEEKLKDLVSE